MLLDVSGMRPHLAANHVTGKRGGGEEDVENTRSVQTQTKCVFWPRPLCYDLECESIVGLRLTDTS